MMTKHEYEFLTGTWEGVKGGAAYFAVKEFCKEFGWYKVVTSKGVPILTQKGVEAVKAYQAEENRKRVDVV